MREPQEVIQAMRDEAIHRDLEKKCPWSVPMDGAEKQRNTLLDLICSYRPDVTIILDFIHLALRGLT